MTSQRRTRPRGFTLVEMLMVIAIICLLVGLLVPNVYAARLRVLAARSQARINELAGGCEAYRQATNYYPGQQYYHNSVRAPAIGAYSPNKEYLGSQILAACLFGLTIADLDTGNLQAQPPMYCSYRTSDLLTPAPSLQVSNGAGGLLSSRLPVYGLVSDRFSGAETGIAYYPSILGRTGFTTTTTTTDVDSLWEFHPFDNAGLNSWTGSGIAAGAFKSFVTDTRISATSTLPYNSGTYLLIAPGIDRWWGTADDLHNY